MPYTPSQLQCMGRARPNALLVRNTGALALGASMGGPAAHACERAGGAIKTRLR